MKLIIPKKPENSESGIVLTPRSPFRHLNIISDAFHRAANLQGGSSTKANETWMFSGLVIPWWDGRGWYTVISGELSSQEALTFSRRSHYALSRRRRRIQCSAPGIIGRLPLSSGISPVGNNWRTDRCSFCSDNLGPVCYPKWWAGRLEDSLQPSNIVRNVWVLQNNHSIPWILYKCSWYFRKILSTSP